MSLSPSHQQLVDDVERHEALPCTEEDTYCLRPGRFFPYAQTEETEEVPS